MERKYWGNVPSVCISGGQHSRQQEYLLEVKYTLSPERQSTQMTPTTELGISRPLSAHIGTRLRIGGWLMCFH